MPGRARRPRPDHATAVAYLALFVALGGSSYAAVQLSRGDVRSRHIANGQVKRPDIARGAVNSAKVRDGSLLSQDFAAGQLPAGARGETGATGERGADGPTGPSGVSGLVRVRTPSALQASESVKFAQAICPEGKRVIGAGADIRAGVSGDPPNQLSDVVINEIIPSEESVVPGTVTVRAYEITATGEEWGVSALALCATVPQA